MRDHKSNAPNIRGLASVLVPVCATGALVLAATVAIAQQGWAPTVSPGATASPRDSAHPAAKSAAPKTKAAAIPAPAAKDASAAVPISDVEILPATPAAGTSRIETGSTTKRPRSDEYCTNIASPAADARFAWQKKVLTDLEQEIAKRIAVLEEKTAEYRKWLARRDEFSQKAIETLLRIYTRMRPDAAAAQLAELEEETAAAVLMKLEPRIASLILNDMDVTKAARLSATISGAAKIIPAVAARPAIEARAQ